MMTDTTTYPVCVGDLLLERFLELPELPTPDTTLILDQNQQVVGGSVFNLCWHFAQLGKTASILVPAGKKDEIIISNSFKLLNLSTANLIWLEGETNNLFCLYVGAKSYNFYFRQEFPADICEQIYSRCCHLSQLILCGSRHAQIRNAFLNIAQTFQGDLLVFNPSYAVYEYSSDALREIIARSHLTIMNEHEADFVCRTLSVSSLNQAIHDSSSLIITYAERGAKLYQGTQQILVPSIAENRVRKDVIGAGDAFLAGFLHGLSQKASIKKALHTGAALAAIVVDTYQVRPNFDIIQLEDRINRTTHITFDSHG